MFKLNQNTNYYNSWNIFSRVILLASSIKKKNLIIFDNDEEIRKFSKIWNYFKNSQVYTIEDDKDILGLINKNSWTYLANKNIFSQNTINSYDIQKNTINIKLNKNYNIDEIILKLIEFWYKHSPTLSHPWTYHKIWDSLDFRDYFEDVEYKISFFWDEIDEILYKTTNFDKLDYEKTQDLYISNLNYTAIQSNKTILDNLDIFTSVIPNLNKNINENPDTVIPVCPERNTLGVEAGIQETSTRHSEFISESNKTDPETSSGWRHKITSQNDEDFKLIDCQINSKWQLQTFLIWLDFFDWLEKLKKLNPIILSDTPSDNSKDLWINILWIDSLEKLSEVLKNKENTIEIYTKNVKTITNFIEYNDIIWDIEIIETSGSVRYLESFLYNSTLYICDDILSNIFIKKRSKRSLSKNIDLLLEIKPWDYIVHIDHGIWLFRSIIIKDLSWIKREYLEIEYKDNDKLFVPISELHRISKYIWDDEVKLTRLNSKEWEKTIKKTEEEVEKIAEELLEIYAKRNITNGYSFVPFPEKEKEFANNFQYKHTLDQSNSIQEILDDMEKVKPTDRLLVWDVGFWKTEVACNAIYRCLLNKKQVAFISPLVILAYEHYETIIKRFTGLWYKIEVVTRIEKPSKIEKILKELASWEIDIIIWTHRLLSEDIRFKNLWLLIIDEEHRFWVIDKEKITKIKEKIDILSLSATPIPRSLNFALNWIKDISIISTPPPLKKPIKTYALKWSDEAIIDAIKKEFERDGQVIFIHNRIATIDATKNYLQKLLWPKIKIVITHGQMNWIEVEDRILDFKNHKYNILLSTTVIENWVNFLNANTIIIDEADKFGLSQLHQLRWRVWRKDKEWYCYLSYRNENLADDAKKRIVTIVNNTHLWAWFEIAMRDLEIRWAWDILGIKQSWRSKETWISLYLRLLEEKIEELKNWKKKLNNLCQIELWLSFYISDDFFSSEADKIHFFRNIESIETEDDLDFTYDTFIKWNDYISEEFENLFLILKSRIVLSKKWVVSLKKVGKSYIFELDKTLWVEEVKNFLDKFDKTWDFVIITIHKIKVETECFAWDKDFLMKII